MIIFLGVACRNERMMHRPPYPSIRLYVSSFDSYNKRNRYLSVSESSTVTLILVQQPTILR
jgi:hypothetical protein